MNLKGRSERIWDQKHQKWLNIVRVDPPKRRRADNFVGCPVWWLKAVLPLVRTKSQFVVAIYLWRRRVVCGNRATFEVPNGELAAWGINRRIKYRTVAILEAAGVIKVGRRGKEALTVTILSPGNRKKNGRGEGSPCPPIRTWGMSAYTDIRALSFYSLSTLSRSNNRILDGE
jgi:hypothetical protein